MQLPLINPNQLSLMAEIAHSAGRIFSLYGQGGVGKTSMLQNIVAPALNIDPTNIYLVNLSGSGPQEALGYGLPDMETKDMYFSNPTIWPTKDRVKAGTRCMLILDEFTDYDLAIQSLLRGIYCPFGGRGKVGTHELTDDLFICPTGTRRADGSSKSSLPPAPFVERSFAFELDNNLDSFIEYAFSIPEISESPLIAFLAFSNGLRFGNEDYTDHYCPPVVAPWDGSPHPCPRTWEAAMHAERKLFNDGVRDPETMSMALRSCVGELSGTTASAFISTVYNDLPFLQEVKKGNKDVRTHENDKGRQYGIVYSAIRLAVRDHTDLSNAMHGGKLDWLIDGIIIPAHSDIRTWAYSAAMDAGIPLDEHQDRRQMQGAALDKSA